MSASETTAPWRVTFHDSRTFAEEYDRNLVKGGLFVPTNMMLALRDVVDFVLVVPFNQREIHGRGEVIYVIEPQEAARRGIQSGVGLQLVQFDRQAAAEARKVIGEVMNQAALQPPEQREAARVPARIKIRYQADAWTDTGLTRDISRGGLFLLTDRDLAEGTSLKVSLVQSARGRDLVIESRVVRREIARLPGPHPEGLGLAFRGLTPENQRRTDRFVCCLDLRRRSLSAQSIRGKLDEAGVENVIKIFGKSGRDGELVLRHGQQAGKIAFQAGKVVRAELPTPGVFGQKAFYQMMTWDGGDFDYRSCRVNPAPGLSRPADDLLRDGRTFKAETLEWRKRIPPERKLVPGPRFDPSALCVPVEALPLVEMLQSTPSVADALDRLGSSELESYRLIDNLRSRGLVLLA